MLILVVHFLLVFSTFRRSTSKRFNTFKDFFGLKRHSKDIENKDQVLTHEDEKNSRIQSIYSTIKRSTSKRKNKVSSCTDRIESTERTSQGINFNDSKRATSIYGTMRRDGNFSKTFNHIPGSKLDQNIQGEGYTTLEIQFPTFKSSFKPKSISQTKDAMVHEEGLTSPKSSLHTEDEEKKLDSTGNVTFTCKEDDQVIKKDEDSGSGEYLPMYSSALKRNEKLLQDIIRLNESIEVESDSDEYVKMNPLTPEQSEELRQSIENFRNSREMENETTQSGRAFNFTKNNTLEKEKQNLEETKIEDSSKITDLETKTNDNNCTRCLTKS